MNCFLDNLNQYHQWTFDDQIPRSKIHYELSMNDNTSIMIIPDFDLEVDLGKYECSTTNIYGTTMRFINIDRDMLKLD
ncbi:unnamed protein product [Rotaria sp. Silwood2]|nr:unnamed protein product [Rotaria sp. Silwood2]